MTVISLRTKARIKDIFWNCDTESVEIILGFIISVWGASLLFPPYDKFSLVSAYRVMGVLFPQIGWGILMLLFGIGMLYGTISERISIRKGAALGSTTVWALIAASIFMSNPLAPSVILIGFLSLAAVWVYLRRTREGK